MNTKSTNELDVMTQDIADKMLNTLMTDIPGETNLVDAYGVATGATIAVLVQMIATMASSISEDASGNKQAQFAKSALELKEILKSTLDGAIDSIVEHTSKGSQQISEEDAKIMRSKKSDDPTWN